MGEVQEKKLKTLVKSIKLTVKAEKKKKVEKKPTVSALTATMNDRRKEIYADKAKNTDKRASNPTDPRRYDERTLLPALKDLLHTWENFPGKDRLPQKEKRAYVKAGNDLMSDIRLVELCHIRVDLTKDYFEFLMEMMELLSENNDMICAIAMEIATLTHDIYEYRRKQEHARANFNTSSLIPYHVSIGGSFTGKCLVKRLVQYYVTGGSNDEYCTLCGLRALINLAALSDECKMQIIGDQGQDILNILQYSVLKNFNNNEVLLSTFCLLIRNICAGDYARQVINRNSDLRKKLVNQLMKILLTQEVMKMSDEGVYNPTRSASRNLMTAEACACMWKLCQPYEPDNTRMKREEEEEKQKQTKKSGKKKEILKYMENCILEDVAINAKKTKLYDQIFTLLKKHVETEDYDNTSDEVVEKACGLAMALASADRITEGMDFYVEDLTTGNSPNAELAAEITHIRPKKPRTKSNTKRSVRLQMGEKWVNVLSEILKARSRSKAVVEKAAGALCVLLTEPDNVQYFQVYKDHPEMETLLSMSVTTGEKQLKDLVEKLNMHANSS